MATAILPIDIQDLYDENFYRGSNPDLARLTSRELSEHLFTFGIDEGRKFSPYFDFDFYQASNPDLAGLNNRQLLDNFLTSGLAQGRQFIPYFDLNFYRNNNPDLAGFDNPQLLQHFINFGLNEGRNFSPVFNVNEYRASNPQLGNLSNQQLFSQLPFPVPPPPPPNPILQLFDAQFYRSANPDLAEANITTDSQLLDHFLNFGVNEPGRRFSPYFDLNYYINNNPDLPAAGLTRRQALDHFQSFGLDEQRRYSQFFDVQYYIDNNPDLRAAGLSRRQAYLHFVNTGLDEGRRPSLIFNPSYYLANNPDLFARQLSFRRAFENFQIGDPAQGRASGFQQARPASIFFDPSAIAPLLSGGATQTERLQNPNEWDDIPAGGTLTYSFVTTASAFLYQIPGLNISNVSEVTPQIKENVRNIMRQYGEVIGINLVEVPDRPPNVGRIRVLFSDYPASIEGSISFVFGPPDSPGDDRAGDIHLNPVGVLDPNVGIDFSAGPGSLSYEILLNAVGKALGLNDYEDERGEQGQSTAPDLPLGRDNNTNTVISENIFPGAYDGSYASTPMPFDIRALQFLYGASYLNNTDSVYAVSNSDLLLKRTIWDAGGIDTLDFSGLSPLPPEVRVNNLDYYFDMNEGGQNTAQIALPRQSPPSPIATGATYTVPLPGTGTGGENEPPPPTFKTTRYTTSIAFGTEIENLIGSQGNDEILGNNLRNNITAGAGNDKIAGSRGPDVITGGPGIDTFVLAAGDGGPTPEAADFIADFRKEEGDKIGLALGLPFGALSIIQGSGANANDTFIRIANGEYLAVLAGVPAAALNAGDFISADIQSVGS